MRCTALTARWALTEDEQLALLATDGMLVKRPLLVADDLVLVGCDNAHAVHPNHAEKCDARNQVVLNGGIVVKEAANQHYCTDAFSRAVFQAICDDADVPTQTFANKSDMAGGSTLGNLSNMQASMHAVDVGLPQLAMHSSYETGGVRDVMYAIRALTAFYERDLTINGAESVEL